jgi:hypothetical protein
VGGTGTGDAEGLAALIELATLMIGVDSGPLHVAGATTTPTLGVWLRHHPLHYFGLADNVTHLVPENHAALLRGDRAAGEAFFRAHYRHQTYRDLDSELRALARAPPGHGRRVGFHAQLLGAQPQRPPGPGGRAGRGRGGLLPGG